MADLSKIRLNGTNYNLKDAVARPFIITGTNPDLEQNTITLDKTFSEIINAIDNNKTVFLKIPAFQTILYLATYDSTDVIRFLNTSFTEAHLSQLSVYCYIDNSATIYDESETENYVVSSLENEETFDGTYITRNGWESISISAVSHTSRGNAWLSLDASSGTAFLSASEGTEIKNVITPTANGDAANKKYVDDAVAAATPTETDPTVPAWAKQSTKPTYTASEVGAVPSDIQDNGNRVNIITNASSFLTKFGVSLKGNNGTSTAKFTLDASSSTPQATLVANRGLSIVQAEGYPGVTINSSSITGLSTPTADSMATNKKYVDDAVSGITVPTAVSSLTNDSGYQNSTQVQSAINTAIGNINSFEVAVVSALPTSDIQDHTIYFVPQAVNSSVHDEYMYINNNWELIGTTSVDLSGYLQSSDIAAWAKASTKPSYTASEVGALPDTYTAPVTSVNGQTGVVSLTIPTVPTNISSFTNDSGYLTLATLPVYDGTVQNG